MRTVEFEGASYKIEDWVTHMTKDSNGVVWVYANHRKPSSPFCLDSKETPNLTSDWQLAVKADDNLPVEV